MVVSGFQDVAEPHPVADVIAQLQALGFVDKTALIVLFAFFVMGLFKGLIWQVSRIGILITAYVVAGRFGHEVAEWIAGPMPPALAEQQAELGGQQLWPEDTTLYLAYCVLFLAVLVALSLLTMLLKKLADKAGLGFFDRLGGGVLGVATGSCVVLALLMAIHMFFPGSRLAQAAESSHSLRLSRRAIEVLGTAVDDDLRRVLELAPLQARDPMSPHDPLGGLQQGLPASPAPFEVGVDRSWPPDGALLGEPTPAATSPVQPSPGEPMPAAGTPQPGQPAPGRRRTD